MQGKILAVANFEQQKYFFEPEFLGLPEMVRKEIQVVCVSFAQKLGCTFLMGFHEDGEIYFESVQAEEDLNFDEIGAELEIKKILRERKELLKMLRVWYRIYFTEEGEKLKKELEKEI